MTTITRKQRQGESPYDYCLTLIADDNLAEAQYQASRITAPAECRIAEYQIACVRHIRLCVAQGKKSEALELCSDLIGEVREKFRRIIKRMGETPVPCIGEGVQEPVALNAQEEPPSDEGEAERNREDVAERVREALGDVRGHSNAFSDAVFVELTHIAYVRWQQNWNKNALGIKPSELAMIGRLLQSAFGERQAPTVDALQQELQWQRPAVQTALRGIRTHILKGTYWEIIDGEGGTVTMQGVLQYGPDQPAGGGGKQGIDANRPDGSNSFSG